jgi:hypothetical protein
VSKTISIEKETFSTLIGRLLLNEEEALNMGQVVKAQGLRRRIRRIKDRRKHWSREVFMEE